MNKKVLLFTVFSMILGGSVIAQDKIFKSSGSVIDAKIRNVGSGTIIYTRHDNPNGPEYTIPKSDVDKIRYENGTEESFTRSRQLVRTDRPVLNNGASNDLGRTSQPSPFNKHILAFAPIQFTEHGIAGFSFSYEVALDPRSIIAFYVPAIAEFNLANRDYYGVATNRTDPMFYLMPGIKIYPTGGYGLAKYAIGPSLVIATGTKTSYYDPYYSAVPSMTENQTKFGMVINQSININPTRHLYLGSEFGFGFTYLNRVGGVYQNTAGLVQFSFKIGYRY